MCLYLYISFLRLHPPPHHPLPFLQVLVAFISFSETMLLVYLSYKVSYSWPPAAILKPFVMSVAVMSTCGGWGGVEGEWGIHVCDMPEGVVCPLCTILCGLYYTEVSFSPLMLLLSSWIFKDPHWAIMLCQHCPVIDTSEKPLGSPLC